MLSAVAVGRLFEANHAPCSDPCCYELGVSEHRSLGKQLMEAEMGTLFRLTDICHIRYIFTATQMGLLRLLRQAVDQISGPPVPCYRANILGARDPPLR